MALPLGEGPTRPPASCPVCNDCHWVLPINGGAIRCPACQAEAMAAERWQKALAFAGSGRSLDRFRFETFDRKLDPHAYDVAHAYAEDATGWLVFTGDTGRGKSHLAAAVLYRITQTGRQPVWAVVPDLMDRLRRLATTDDAAEKATGDAMRDALINADVLLLDDMGVERQTPFVREEMYRLIDHRYRNRLSTVVTTNLKPSSADWEPRVRSRLFDQDLTTVVAMRSGSDYRLAGR